MRARTHTKIKSNPESLPLHNSTPYALPVNHRGQAVKPFQPKAISLVLPPFDPPHLTKKTFKKLGMSFHKYETLCTVHGSLQVIPEDL